MNTRPVRKPTAAILDMDGSLCDTRALAHLVVGCKADWHEFTARARHCPSNSEALEFAAEQHSLGRVFVLATARTEFWRPSTVDWLEEHFPYPVVAQYHRQHGDTRRSVDVKRSMYRSISQRYDVRAAIDDEHEIADMWFEMGIPVVHRVRGGVSDLIREAHGGRAPRLPEHVFAPDAM